MLLISLVAWEVLDEAVFPELEPGMCEGVWFANLWDSKDPKRIKEKKVFLVLFDRALATSINSQSCLLPMVYKKYKDIASFQVTMHNL